MSQSFEQATTRVAALKESGGPVGQAHPHCGNNRDELERSTKAGCFYCCEIYQASFIDEWIDDETTAMCPKCGIDSVIGDASGFPVTEKAFLKAMNEVWF